MWRPSAISATHTRDVATLSAPNEKGERAVWQHEQTIMRRCDFVSKCNEII